MKMIMYTIKNCIERFERTGLKSSYYCHGQNKTNVHAMQDNRNKRTGKIGSQFTSMYIK
jgi:hypothetical protein